MLLLALLLSTATFATVGYLHFENHIPAYQLLDDATDYAGVKWYTGLLSNVVVLLWCASAAVCAFASRSLSRAAQPHLLRVSQFLRVMALINIWLTFDDLFLLHEQLARLLFGKEHQHIGEGLLLGLYATAVALSIWQFRNTIHQTTWLLLAGAIVSLAGSAAIDVGFQLEMKGHNLFRESVLSVSWGAGFIDILEEILKLNGALLWFVYLAGTGLAGVRLAMAGTNIRFDRT